jgi:hypothetical protein
LPLPLPVIHAGSYGVLCAGAMECVAVGWVFKMETAERAVGALPVRVWAAAYTVGCVGSGEFCFGSYFSVWKIKVVRN